MEQAALTVENLSVAYHDKLVVDTVSATIHRGQIVGLIGPNGAGKSTILKASMGLIPALAGRVSFAGKDLRTARSQVGYMPQSAEVDWDFPTTVLDVVMMGCYGRLKWYQWPTRADRAAATAALHQVGLGDYAHRQISQLSGGQKQRTFLARILFQNPDTYLLDEPFAGVDAASEQTITTVLKTLHQQGKTIIIVHHDLASVAALCTHAILLSEGRAIASGNLACVLTATNIARAYGIDPTLLLTDKTTT